MKNTDRYDSLFKYYAFLNGLDWRLLKAQVAAESSFDPRAVNAKSNCKGLAQFADLTFTEWGRFGDPFNPEEALRAQALYMVWLQKTLRRTESEEILEKALASFNWGIGNMRKHLAKNKLTTFYWMHDLPHETANYVTKILTEYKRLCELDV